MMASAEIPSTHQQAGYMCASLPTALSKKALAFEAGPYMPPKFIPCDMRVRSTIEGPSFSVPLSVLVFGRFMCQRERG